MNIHRISRGPMADLRKCVYSVAGIPRTLEQFGGCCATLYVCVYVSMHACVHVSHACCATAYVCVYACLPACVCVSEHKHVLALCLVAIMRMCAVRVWMTIALNLTGSMHSSLIPATSLPIYAYLHIVHLLHSKPPIYIHTCAYTYT